MAARDQQQQIRKGHIFAQANRQCMALEVIDGQQRLVVRESQRLGGHDAHHHPADQTRSTGGGNAVKFVEAQSGLVQRLDEESVEAFEMGAGGDLRHDAAEAAMLGELGIDDIGADEAERRPIPGTPTSGASTTATAVSSQLVSIPSTRMRVF